MNILIVDFPARTVVYQSLAFFLRHRVGVFFLTAQGWVCVLNRSNMWIQISIPPASLVLRNVDSGKVPMMDPWDNCIFTYMNG